MLDLGECQSLDANNLQSAVYLSPVQIPKDGYFMFVQFGGRKAQISGCAYQLHYKTSRNILSSLPAQIALQLYTAR